MESGRPPLLSGWIVRGRGLGRCDDSSRGCRWFSVGRRTSGNRSTLQRVWAISFREERLAVGGGETDKLAAPMVTAHKRGKRRRGALVRRILGPVSGWTGSGSRLFTEGRGSGFFEVSRPPDQLPAWHWMKPLAALYPPLGRMALPRWPLPRPLAFFRPARQGPPPPRSMPRGWGTSAQLRRSAKIVPAVGIANVQGPRRLGQKAPHTTRLASFGTG